jgi:hypothetical protein
MGIDRLKLTNVIKIIAFLAYLIYFYISNMSPITLNEDIAGIKPDTELKADLLSSKCLVLLGGSNVQMGLSAEEASSKSCEAVNLGIGSEAGGFNKYLNWLNKNISADKVIYSSMIIWKASPLIEDNKETKFKFPIISLYSIIKISLFPVENEITPKFNKFSQFGDDIEYQCPNDFLSVDIQINDFVKFNHIINKEIYKRISSLKEATNSDAIFFRVPPVYVKNKKKAALYTSLMNKRIEILKGLGVKIIGTTIVNSDSSLFCDSLHPNAKGREVFTKEIRLPQSIHDNI